MEGWTPTGGEVPFREGDFTAWFPLFLSNDVPPVVPTPSIYVYVWVDRIARMETLNWILAESRIVPGGYMVPLPRWTSRVSDNGDPR
jgi:hypothetical protein